MKDSKMFKYGKARHQIAHSTGRLQGFEI